MKYKSWITILVAMLAVGLFTLVSLRPSGIRGQTPPAKAIGPQVAQDAAARKDRGAEEDLSGVFLPVDRRSNRLLQRAEELNSEARFADAVVILDSILASQEDWFFPSPGGDSNYRSLKSEAMRLIDQLPPMGRKAYRLQFGSPAHKRLDQALEAGDIRGVAEVSRRYFHTPAGYQATLLLARHHLDHNRPLAAALACQQVLDAQDAPTEFEPALSIQAAVCWHRAGQEEKARELLVRLKRRAPQANLKLGARELGWFINDTQALAWLRQVTGRPLPASDTPRQSWSMYRGNPARNGESIGGRPLLAPRWRVRAANHPAIEQAIRKMQDAYLSHNIVAMPTLHPLAVGDVVLMRTTDHLVAVDFATGKRLWEIHSDFADESDHVLSSPGQRRTAAWNSAQGSGLEQRIWDDATYGTMSCDADRVYFVDDLQVLAGNGYQEMLFQGGQPGQGPALNVGNRLAAVALDGSGAMAWQLGGPHSTHAEWSGAFFLGPPLVLSGRLYLLAEIKSGIRLLVLDAASGELVWSQQLADLEQDITQDPIRRLAGASPSFADGILVCPTSAGAVVAVDLAKRSLAWAYKHPLVTHPKYSRPFMGRVPVFPGNHMRMHNRWVDSTATIADGSVIVTPPGSDKIYCLNLVDGQLRWQEDRGDLLYVGCVDEGRVLLVGKSSVTTLGLDDGKPSWHRHALPLPDSSMPSGRGFHNAGHYYLPVSSAEVLKINLAKGQIVDRAQSPTGTVPGNLICFQDEIISQSAEFLETFYQVEPLKARLEKTLAENPNDADALARQGELALYEGRIAQAIVDLRRSFEQDPNPLTRELLVGALLAALRDDFAGNRRSVDQLQRLIDQPDQRAELLRLVAKGLEAADEPIAAWDAYLQLADIESLHSERVPVEPTRSVRTDRLIRTQLAELRGAVPEDRRVVMEDQLLARLAALGEQASMAQLEQFIKLFDGSMAADQARENLVLKLIDSDRPLLCEAQLRRLRGSPHAEQQRLAVALLARLMRETGRPADAAHYYWQLAGPLRDVVCADARTGRELVEALADNDPVRDALQDRWQWPAGRVEVQVDKRSSQRRMVRPPTTALAVRGDPGPFLAGKTLWFEQRHQPQSIIGHDGLGFEQFSVQVTDPNEPRPTYAANSGAHYATANGHLIVVSLGYEVLGIDTLSSENGAADKVLWRYDLTRELPGLRYPRTVRTRSIPGPGNQPQRQFLDAQGLPLGAVGPNLDEGIAFQRFDDLTCVDPVTGDVLWVREKVPQGSELFGDEHVLFVVPYNSVEAIALRPLDGKEIGRRRVPHSRETMTTIGRKFLTWHKSDSQSVLQLTDPWQEEVVWSRPFSFGAKTWLFDGESIGVYEPMTGKFVLLALDDGRTLIDQQLVREPKTAAIYMMQTPDQYFLFTNQTAAPASGASVKAIPGGSSNPLLSGNLYAFDRQTGEAQWPVPARIDQRGLWLDQPSQLPVLVFVQQASRPREGNRRHVMTTSVLCLDKRTGRAVHELVNLPQTSSAFVLQGDAARKTVTIQLPSTTLTLRFTDQPLPPEPPLQADIEQAVAQMHSKGVYSILSAIPRAIGQAALKRNATRRAPVEQRR